MYLTILILPLLGSLISGFFGRIIGVKGAQILTCVSIIITTLLSIIIFIEIGFNHIPVYIKLFK
jgi:NADH-ubiquinone oxidoreductase chain 5